MRSHVRQIVIFTSLLMVLSGGTCGTVMPGPQGERGPQGFSGLPGPAGPVGPAGLAAPVPDGSLLSWGVFVGEPATVVASGGPIAVSSFTRISKGIYRVVYNVATNDVGLVATIATAADGGELPTGENTPSIIAATMDTFASNLTVEISGAMSIVDANGAAMDHDLVFSLVILGTMP